MQPFQYLKGVFLTTVLACAILAASACGGGSVDTATLDAGQQYGIGDPESAARALETSSITVDPGLFRMGAEFEPSLPKRGISVYGTSATLTPSGGAGAWGSYAFDLTGYEGENTLIATWEPPPEEGRGWLGLPNYDSGRWDFVPLSRDLVMLPDLEPYLAAGDVLICVALVDGGEPAVLSYMAIGWPADGALLPQIPEELEGYADPFSHSKMEGTTAEDAPGETALRMWASAELDNIVVAQLSDWMTEEDAIAALEERIAAYGDEAAVGDYGWMASDNQADGSDGFNLLQFRRGPYLCLIGAGVLEAGAEPAPLSLLSSLGAAIDANLVALLGGHGASAAPARHAAASDGTVDIPLAMYGWPPDASCATCGHPAADFLRYASAAPASSVSMPFDIIKGGKVNGTITLRLDITPTDEPCVPQWYGFMTIVKIYIESISISAGGDDGDGAGRGAGDMMVGGNISVSFSASGGGGDSSGGFGFATGEVGDCGEGESLEGGEGDVLPKHIGTIKGCGVPSKIDLDIVVRDNDSGTDVQDIVGALVVAGTGYLAGDEAAGQVADAVDGLGDKSGDLSGTDGMKLVRDKDGDGKEEPGDDVGENHEAQRKIK
jgi:hypothetical protein